MNRDEAMWEDDRQDRRRRCDHCREFFEADDRRAVRVPGRRRSSDGWCCSRECLRKFLQRAAGNEAQPYYGEQLEQGFRMLNASHETDW